MKKLLAVLTIIIIGEVTFFGWMKRASYTDITAEENFMERMVVAELSEQLAASACNEMKEQLGTVPIVLRVAPQGEMEYLYDCGRQKVIVKEVYRGEGIEIGQEVYVSFFRWLVALIENYNTVQCGFVNIMKEDKEYLVFLDASFIGLDGEEVYPFFGENFVTPMLCFAESDNVIISVKEEISTYVPYSQVSENEFFVTSEGALEIMQNFKEEMMEEYVKK